MDGPPPAKSWQSLLAHPGRLARLAGAHNPLGARLVAAAGFDGVWASSLEISTAHAVRDTDAVTVRRVLPAVAAMAAAVACPVMADGGTGGRDAGEVSRLVQQLQAAGAAAVAIADARYPTSNSLLPGPRELVELDEFAAKVAAAKDASRGADFGVIARVEALIARTGLDDAVARAAAYVAAGADAILIHSKDPDPEQILAFVSAWDRPAPLVLVPTTYPTLTEATMKQTEKVRLVIYANHGLRAALAAVRRVHAQILHDGSALGVEQWIAGLDELFDLQRGFDPDD